ncbi:hypothetical protein CBL_05902 [Carabus blaptoides fortunei]
MYGGVTGIRFKVTLTRKCVFNDAMLEIVEIDYLQREIFGMRGVQTDRSIHISGFTTSRCDPDVRYTRNEESEEATRKRNRDITRHKERMRTKKTENAKYVQIMMSLHIDLVLDTNSAGLQQYDVHPTDTRAASVSDVRLSFVKL